MFKLFGKTKNIKSEIETRDARGPIVNQEIKTLESLAMTEKSFWKFSQSQQGRSAEKQYISYKEGEIVVAEDMTNENGKMKLLSFVEEANILKCYMYGDMVTKLCFDLNNPRFQEIKDIPFHYIGGALEEYEAEKLLVEKNYSLSEISTIVWLIKREKDILSLHSFLTNSIKGKNNNFDSLKDRLESWGYEEAAQFVGWIGRQYDFNCMQSLKILHESIEKLEKKYFQYNGVK